MTFRFDTDGNYFNNLEQLISADPEVFTSYYYARIAQKAEGRQPILVNSLGQPLDGFPGPRLFIGEPFLYRGNYYASVNEKCPFVRLSNQINEKGLQMPMCFTRASASANANACSPSVSENPREKGLYVFTRDKNYIPKDRYAYVPEDIATLLNRADPDIFRATVNGCIKAGFDCYLRKGMSVENPKNVFLHAIASFVAALTPSTGIQTDTTNGVDFREFLISKITPEIFSTLLNGNLKLLFQREKDSDPYAIFIEYLRNEYINEDLLWDFITRPGVILPSGMNLIIFEAVQNPNKSIKAIKLKFPIGFDTDTLFQYDRPSILLYKYNTLSGEHYEPIYRVYEQESTLLEERFVPPSSPFIQNILDVYTKGAKQTSATLMPMVYPFVVSSIKKEQRIHDDR